MQDHKMQEENSNNRKRGVVKYLVLIVIILVTYVGVFYLGNILATKGIVIGSIPSKAVSDLEDIKDTEKYSNLFNLRSMLFSMYNGEIDDEKLLEGAMKGMADAIGDPYTVYMDRDEFKSFMESSQGSFYGIGAQLGVRDNNVKIISPIKGSPAEKAGLKDGDIILKVDDYEVKDLNVEAVVSRVRGEKGEPVTLKVKREGIEEPFDINIVRDEIKTESVKGEILEDGIGYMQITTFSDEELSDKFNEKLNELKQQGMKKLILDLRGNPGGYLNECVEMVSNFIPSGEVITYTIDKYDKKVTSNSIGGNAIGMPLVVLVNGGSASASEVVTGALRDYKAATIIGTKTFGKGIVQQLKVLPNDMGGLKVTVSKYYTPNGENIHGIGIEPDILVEIPQEVLKMDYDRNIDPQFQKALEVIREKN
ncbi:S41 family peptidase [uncultured Clostridium sp.]|uniref:S41 family peptidase n=1 Tax=uncultured Clostridium sp. TaxID=59620 RepID=UPI00262A143D|nr:S41 family peptidase [uncultured Clostridium sp.]